MSRQMNDDNNDNDDDDNDNEQIKKRFSAAYLDRDKKLFDQS